MKSDLVYWVWLAALPGLTDRQRWLLLNKWRTPRAVYEAPEGELFAAAELRRGRGANRFDRDLSAAEHILRECERAHMAVLSYDDDNYPRRLWDVFAPPTVLYALGRVRQLDDEPAVAAVGTRKPSPYGEKMAEIIGRDLTEYGLTVVSGMAKGIDGCALWGAIRAGGSPVAVLGSGADVCYPAENRKLYEAILEQGTVLSAYPPHTKPERWHFPERNRIISGVTLGTLVVEAPARRSGALLTADSALEQGRDVFALPGAVDNPAAGGCLELLRQGAILATMAADVAEFYRPRFPHLIRSAVPPPEIFDDRQKGALCTPPATAPDLPRDQAALLRCLEAGPLLIDELAYSAGVPVTEALSALTLLEIEGYVKKTGARYTAVPTTKE